MQRSLMMEQQHASLFANDFSFQHGHERRLSTVAEEQSAVRRQLASPLTASPDAEEHPAAKRQRTGYPCMPCNMSFTEKRALARHKKTDHHRRQIGLPPDRRYACNICGKYFTRGHDLKRHQNEQHPDHDPAAVELSSRGSEYSTEQASFEDPPQSFTPASSNIHSPAALDVQCSVPSEPSPLTKYVSLPAPCTASIETDSKPAIRRQTDTKTATHMTGLHRNQTSQSSAEVPRLSSLPDLMETENTDSSEGSPGSCHTLTSHDSDTVTSAGDRASSLSYPSSFTQARSVETERHTINHAPSLTFNPGQPLLCMVCGTAYEDDPDELVNHLRRHLDTSSGAHQCTECLIGFVHEEDLERHLLCAAKGHCGFSFPHSSPCTGHHPPKMGGNITGLSDNDRIRLSDRLRHWEQAQLQAYISEIDQLHTERRERRASRWSEVVMNSASRRGSQASFAFSVKTFATAPCDGKDGKMDVGGLQKRMQQMSLGNANMRMRRLIRTGSANSQDAIDKALKKAVKQGQVPKVIQHLEAGGDPSILLEDHHFITPALWGQGYVAERMVEHRIDEDMLGKCSKCGMSSFMFEETPSIKVRALLRHKAEVNRHGGLCDYPLVTAAWLGKPDIVKMLLERGAHVNQHSTKYGTALCAAASQAGRPEILRIIKLLLSYGADAQRSFPSGTPRQLASQRLDSLITQSTGSEGWTELNSARMSNCQAVLLALEKAESSPSEVIRDSTATKKRHHVEAAEPTLSIYNWLNT